MNKVEVDYTDCFAQTMKRMQKDGLLLVTLGKDGKPNVMTIGWGTIGLVWGRPIFIVFVRPSRYTYGRLEQVDQFTVNVPTEQMGKAAEYCGKVSGRDHDKFKQANLTIVPGKKVKVPVIDECFISYECRVLHTNDLIPDRLSGVVKKEFYPTGDFHRVYFGQILTVYADLPRTYLSSV